MASNTTENLLVRNPLFHHSADTIPVNVVLASGLTAEGLSNLLLISTKMLNRMMTAAQDTAGAGTGSPAAATKDTSYTRFMNLDKLHIELFTSYQKRKPCIKVFKKRLNKFMENENKSLFIEKKNGTYRYQYRRLDSYIELLLNKRTTKT